MKITKKRLFDFCNENNDALNDLQSQSDSTDFVLSTLIDQLKDLGVIDKLGDEPSEPKLKQLDQSVFDGLDEKWRFAARCLSGKAIATESEPRIILNGYYCEGGYLLIGEGYDTSNWQNSLIERDIAKEPLEVDLSSELTGSELCRAMLARGDRWILCGNTTDGFASPCVIDGYRCNEDDLGFVLTNGKSIEPQYIHPVNNQGEPLTQAEAGL